MGGPRGAWERGFELTYWYDAFTPAALEDLNRRLPVSPQIDFLSEKTKSAVAVFADERSLGTLRGDVVLGWINPGFPYVWLLTQDSKATSFTRLLFAMQPWYSRDPVQLDGARVATVSDPVAVSRAWGLFVMLEAPDLSRRDGPAVPAWVTRYRTVAGAALG